MTTKTVKKLEEVTVEPLIEKEVLTQKFDHFSKNISLYTEFSKDIVVNDEIMLDTATKKSSEINAVIKNVEEVHKTLKAPYLATTQMLDQYKKAIVDQLERAKKAINEAVTNYKVVQAATARAAVEAEARKLEKERLEKEAEVVRLNRIERQLIARLYGGIWETKDGQKGTSSGCLSVEECDALTKFIDEKYPSADTYKYMKAESEELKRSTYKLISKLKVNLINFQSDDVRVRNLALKLIQESKIDAGMKSEERAETIVNKINREEKKSLKDANNIFASNNKGLRKLLKFVVTDISVVPTKYLQVDESKVKEFLSDKSDDIKERLINREDVKDIPGIKFYIEESYVSN